MRVMERTFASWDGTELFYRAWIPAHPDHSRDGCATNAPAKSLLLFHRGHEHSGRWQETVESLGLDDVAVFAWDQRGHGRSPGERGAAEGLSAIVKDADCFARHIASAHGYPIAQMAVLAHSVGAVIATAWVHDYAPPIRAMVLAAPAFRVKLYVPMAVPALRAKRAFSRGGCGGTVKSYVKASVLTHDFTQQQAYRSDPLIFRQIAVNILLDLHDTSSRLLADAGAITVPTLILAAEKDWVVKLGAQREFFRKLSSPIKQMEVLPDFYHAIFQEKDRQLAVEKTRNFLRDAYAQPPGNGQLIHEDRGGYTRTEYDLLRSPGSPRWKVMRGFIKAGGAFSRGMRIGNESGFDSGVMLDYVYRNQSAGRTPIGRLIDHFYLNSIGWRGIRVRRQNLERILRQAMIDLHAAGRPARVLDIAAGPGRYVLGVIRDTPAIPATAVLRDYRQANLDAAQTLAEEFGVKDVEFLLGDAFDRASLAATLPRPTVAIASGLYELFPDNEPVLRSLRGIADALEPGGLVIYTNQPWHPQMEFIARSLINREGQPWIMRRRTQAEMDALVAAAGFAKISQDIDPWGIFTVSLARRTEGGAPNFSGGVANAEICGC